MIFYTFEMAAWRFPGQAGQAKKAAASGQKTTDMEREELEDQRLCAENPFEDPDVREKASGAYWDAIYRESMDLRSREEESEPVPLSDRTVFPRKTPRYGYARSWNEDMDKLMKGRDFRPFLYQKSGDSYYGCVITGQLQDPEGQIRRKLSAFFYKAYQIYPEIHRIREITSEAFTDLVDMAREADLIPYELRDWMEDEQGTDYMLSLRRETNGIRAREKVLEMKRIFLQRDAEKQAEQLLLGADMKAELKRIYAKENRREFLGHPVHYLITAAAPQAAYPVIRLIMNALYVNGRLPGSRLSILRHIQPVPAPGAQMFPNEGPDINVEHLFANVDGSSLAVDFGRASEILALDSSSADRQEKGVDRADEWYRISSCLRDHLQDTLLFVIRPEEDCEESRNFLESLPEGTDFVQIRVDKMPSRPMAVQLLDLMQDEEKLRARFDFKEILPEMETYDLGSLVSCYEDCMQDVMKRRFYPSYRNMGLSLCSGQEGQAATLTPYQELQQMIGLSEVKETVGQLKDYFAIQKIRKQKSLKTSQTARHMCFTGNPGTAKTSVARLLARILKSEGILRTGVYVECGRKDLVGKYVGWTAKNVSKYFEKASGGVLFIDEAYSLADREKSFGDEAINTIVQEMENHRDDVIVIFAGYPDKMEEFLDQNEGLRSRIAYHLSFPDYSVTELTDILGLMADQKGYHLSRTALCKARDIFQKAVQKPGFGNGRYARTLLEQAMMHQARRLMGIRQAEQGRDLSEEELTGLITEDFAELKTEGDRYGKGEQREHHFGFLCG